ncbi:MAG: ImmA/IrrE family metallo-endopeptidase [Pseudobdellovibrionaceae bacterium]
MAKSPKATINPSILKWARQSLGLSMVDLAEKIKVTLETVAAWEQGADYPSFSQLQKIGNALKRPTATFFLENVPESLPVPKDFRVLAETDIKKLSPNTYIEIRKAQRRRQLAIELYHELEEQVPQFNFRATLDSDPRHLAIQYRKHFSVTLETQYEWTDYGALNFWKKNIEKLGVLVFQASLDSLDELRGLALYHKELPVIMINSKDSVRGRIFSLLHEFCHLILHTSGIGNIDPNWQNPKTFNKVEFFCNRFAAEMLIPEEIAIKEKELFRFVNKDGSFNFQKIASAANKFTASQEVVLRKSRDLGILSATDYDKARIELQKFYSNSAKKKVEIRIPIETKALASNGDLFTNLVLNGLDHSIINTADLNNYLDLKPKHIDKLRAALSKHKKGA